MATMVLTAVGDDQAGLVQALSSVVVEHGGNWDRSQMASLAGTFAGIVMVTVPDNAVTAFRAALEPLAAKGLLDVQAQPAAGAVDVERATALLEVVGVDQPGIVHEISTALAGRGITIVELATEIESAAMAGGRLFRATAMIGSADGTTFDLEALESALDDVGRELSVDIDLEPLA